MRRLLLALALLCLLGEVSGVFAAFAPDRCLQSCSDDAPDGQCPPLCQDCGCCTHVVPTLFPSPTVELQLSPPTMLAVARHRQPVPSGSVEEILRVPKPICG